jgi:regulatory protein
VGAQPPGQRRKGQARVGRRARNKGLDNDVIDQALAEIDAGGRAATGVEENCQASSSRERLDDGDDQKVMRRLVGMLARRGYGQGMAFEVVSASSAPSVSGAGCTCWFLS